MGPVITGVVVSIVVMSIAWFGDTTGAELYGQPFMLALALGIFVIQWIGLIHARTFETEKFYDLVGSISYIGVTIFVVSTVESVGVRADYRGCRYCLGASFRTIFISPCVGGWRRSTISSH